MITVDHKIFKFNKLFIYSFTISIIIAVFFFLLFLFPANTYDEIITSKPFASFSNKKDSILDDQVFIFNTEPIFLPSEWNEIPLVPTEEIDQFLFSDLPPQTSLYNYQSLSSIITPRLSILKPLDILDQQPINLFKGINQNKSEISTSNKLKAYLTIENFNDFKTFKTYEIKDKDTPIKDQLWSPLEFLVIIDELVPLIPPLMIQSSGIEEIDIFFKNYISSSLLKLNQLPIGYYQITISP